MRSGSSSSPFHSFTVSSTEPVIRRAPRDCVAGAHATAHTPSACALAKFFKLLIFISSPNHSSSLPSFFLVLLSSAPPSTQSWRLPSFTLESNHTFLHQKTRPHFSSRFKLVTLLVLSLGFANFERPYAPAKVFLPSPACPQQQEDVLPRAESSIDRQLATSPCRAAAKDSKGRFVENRTRNHCRIGLESQPSDYKLDIINLKNSE